MEEFERLKRMAMTSPQGRAAVRYEREHGRRAASSRAELMSELAAAAREKHRGLFAGLNPVPRAT